MEYKIIEHRSTHPHIPKECKTEIQALARDGWKYAGHTVVSCRINGEALVYTFVMERERAEA